MGMHMGRRHLYLPVPDEQTKEKGVPGACHDNAENGL